MDCFLFIYLITTAVAFLGLERLGGEATGRCGECRYDLSGLPPSARCPECGSGKLEMSDAVPEIVVRGSALLAWSPTFLLVLLCVMEPELIRDAVNLPWRLKTGNWEARLLDTQDVFIYIAAVAAPLLARLRNRWQGLVAVLGVIVVAYVACVVTTLR